MTTLFIFGYFFLLGYVAFYGIHLYWLITLYLRSRGKSPIASEGAVGHTTFPRITVQLPIYNEKRVAIRLIESVQQLDWPLNKLQIQILDDSNDETSDIIHQHLKRQDGAYPNTVHIQRKTRIGFKAGALAHGLKSATGDLIAIFDADNIPRPDFLKQLVPYFNDDSIGMVQARWSFLNRDESLLCRAQALFLDAHFRIEQQARCFGGLMLNFNGTAGVWKRKAIDDAGGWQHDTLTEDLDLSMRSQLAGWTFLYIDNYDVPTELPNRLTSFKTQQYRWSKGMIQTGKKLLWTILGSDLPLSVRIGAWFHFTHKTVALALLLLSLLLIPALLIRIESGSAKFFFIDLPVFLAGTGSMTLFYSLANRAGGRKRNWRDIFTLPILTSIGVALAVTNSRALLSALFGRKSAFVRTPKSGSTDTAYRKIPQSYRLNSDKSAILESLLAIYAITAVWLAIQLSLYVTVPFLLTFAFGFGYFSYNGVKEKYA